MANSNSLDDLVIKLLGRGVVTLREACVMARFVNREYDPVPAGRFSTVRVAIPSAATVRDVDPGPTDPAPGVSAPKFADVVLDKWRESDFSLTAKQRAEIDDTIVLPMEAGEKVRALANDVNQYLFGKYTGIYGWAGSAGTAPFGTDTTEAIALDQVLTEQLCPKGGRIAVLNAAAQAKALALNAFMNTSFTGQNNAIISGDIGTRLGFTWLQDPYVPSHTAGVWTNVDVTGAHTADASGRTDTLNVNTLTGGALDLVIGDIITIAGHNQTYTVTAGPGDGTTAPLAALASGTCTIAPGLKVGLSGGENITVKATHAVNLGFHPDAFALASRTLEPPDPALGVIVRTMVDPVTKLALTLRVKEQHYQTNYAWSLLYGAALVRPELACRLAG